MRRRSQSKLPVIIAVGVLILLVFIIMRLLLPSLGEQDPKDVIQAFYESEQRGDFGSAWELFHPVMQEKFSKNAYVTERSHIFMSHYGVNTFSFDLGDEEIVKNWTMAKGEDKFPEAYQVEVEQTFKSKFGTFTVVQDVYVVKVEDEWKVVWDFN